jgi:hypothetical protein
MSNKITKQLLEDIVKNVVKDTIKEELKPIKILVYSLLKEQQLPSKKNKQESTFVETKPSIIIKDENKLNPVLQSLLEQTTPFNEPSSPSFLQENMNTPGGVPMNIESTDSFANMDFRGFMQKVDQKAQEKNNFRP